MVCGKPFTQNGGGTRQAKIIFLLLYSSNKHTHLDATIIGCGFRCLPSVSESCCGRWSANSPEAKAGAVRVIGVNAVAE